MDWREQYTICEDVAIDGNVGTRHRGFRVCCEACCEAGFLQSEELVKVDGYSGLDVRALPVASRTKATT